MPIIPVILCFCGYQNNLESQNNKTGSFLSFMDKEKKINDIKNVFKLLNLIFGFKNKQLIPDLRKYNKSLSRMSPQMQSLNKFHRRIPDISRCKRSLCYSEYAPLFSLKLSGEHLHRVWVVKYVLRPISPQVFTKASTSSLLLLEMLLPIKPCTTVIKHSDIFSFSVSSAEIVNTP